MRDYYQKKRIWKIDDNVFKQTYYFIKQYPKWLSLTDFEESNRFIKEVESSAVNAADASVNIEIVNKSIKNYVPKEYRIPVMAHICQNLDYDEIEAIYGVSNADLKEYKARLIYAVAEEMGWNYI